MAYVAIADRDNEQELHDPQTFITKYVWSQDHKVIAIQYSITAILVGLVALVLSGMMRLQLAFPDTFAFIDPAAYYQFITMHGMIMVIYLLTALFLGGFGNYLIPLMIGSRDMVFPFMNMLSFWVYLLAVIILLVLVSLPRAVQPGQGGRFIRHRQSSRVHPGRRLGHPPDARVAGVLHRGFHNGRFELCDDDSAGPHARHDTDAHAIVSLGYFHSHGTRPAGVPGACWSAPS